MSAPLTTTPGPGIPIELAKRIEHIEAMLEALVAREVPRDFYTVEAFAQAVGKAEFTVRQWCRFGRIEATKQRTGAGPHATWAVSRTELDRYRREGLLPDRRLTLAAR